MKNLERRFQRDISLTPLCTYRIGGPARYFFEPETADEAVSALAWAREKGLPAFVMGLGSNLLIGDKGYPGLLLYTGSKMTGIRFEETGAHVDAGAPLMTLVREACGRGLKGLEDLYGIPGTVGGGIFMNAGAFDGEISRSLVEVYAAGNDGVARWVPKEKLSFGYRTSSYRTNGETILSARFRFEPGAAAELLRHTEAILARRNSKQPANTFNCGSVFKRPPGNYAGTLIEQAGLKGRTVGGARVSEKHANFILNESGATARDVRMLIEQVQWVVFEKSGVRLETEVIFLGDF